MTTAADVLTRIALDEAQSRGLRVAVKTDLGPEVTVYDATRPPGPSLVRFGVVVRDKTGQVLARYGDYPPTNWIKAGSLVLVAGVLAVAVWRGMKA